MTAILLDEGLPLRAAALLCEHSIDTMLVSEIGLHAASDSQILNYGRVNFRTCVTLDSDFHSLLAATSAAAPSVIRLRLQHLGPDKACDVIRAVLERTAAELEKGAVVSVTPLGIRVRRLPIK